MRLYYDPKTGDTYTFSQADFDKLPANAKSFINYHTAKSTDLRKRLIEEKKISTQLRKELKKVEHQLSKAESSVKERLLRLYKRVLGSLIENRQNKRVLKHSNEPTTF